MKKHWKSLRQSNKVNRIVWSKLKFAWDKRLALESLDAFDQAAMQEQMNYNFELGDYGELIIEAQQPAPITWQNEKDHIWQEALVIRDLLNKAIETEQYDIAEELQQALNELQRRYYGG